MDLDPAVLALLPGLGTVLLAIISGAGGSALLELFWKPRRDRQRVAGTLLGEILLNTELALLWTHARQRRPKSIPSDLLFSSLGWDAVAGLVSELHPDLLKSALLLYRRYERLNFCVQEYARLVDEFQSVPDSPRSDALKKEINATIDVFNTSIDKVIEQGKELSAKLMPVAGFKADKELQEPTRDFAADVDKLLAGRARRMRALEEE